MINRQFYILVVLIALASWTKIAGISNANALFEDVVSKVDLSNSRIKISGSNYTVRTRDTIYFKRFSNEVLAMGQLESKLNPVRAHTTSGIVISFKTSSPSVHLNFTVQEGENRGHKFAVYQDGSLTGDYYFSKTDGPELQFDISSAKPGNEVVYEIAMPNWSITALSGLEIDEGYELLQLEEVAKPVYVAYGNSITHGTGQNGTHKTYPFLVSQQLDLDLYNVAVGGAKTSVVISEMLRDDFDKIDYMTMLIGYNDYNGEGITTSEYRDRYLNFLRTFREKHMSTEIYCLSMTYTTTSVSAKTGISADEFRQVTIDVVDLLRAEGDEHIYLVHGDSISSLANLNDAVHFSETGAALFADELAQEMEKKKSPVLGIDDTTPIRQLVEELFPSGNLFIGSACHETYLGTNTETILDREFSYVTPANDFKQSYIHPEPGIWRWDRSDTWVEHCRESKQLIRMHAPISPQCSKWAKEDTRTGAELELMLEEYMVGLCKKYNDTAHIKWLDVVNETLNADGSWFGPRAGTDKWENPWPLIGYDETVELRPPLYIKQAFEFANQHAPDLQLIINQHGRFEEAAWEKMKELVLYLRGHDLRVDGIGWQAHLDLGWEKDTANMGRLSRFIDWCHQNDLEFHITEFNIFLRDGNEGNYQGQADSFYEITKLVASKQQSGIIGINYWHIRGVETANPDRDGCMWTDNYEPKQAFFDVKRALVEIASGTGPLISSIPFESVTVSEQYTYQVVLRGAIGNPSYKLKTDTAAPWLSIDQNGLLTGSPGTSGKINVTITITDDIGSSTHEFTLNILPRTLEITSTPIELASEGVLYEYQVEYNGEGTFSIQTYMSITWLSIDQEGLLSGIPDISGTIPIIVKFTNEFESVKQEFELLIEEGVGIQGHKNTGIELYPNPANEACYIHNLPLGSEYALINTEGREILRMSSKADPEIIELHAFPAGQYLLKTGLFPDQHNGLLIVH